MGRKAVWPPRTTVSLRFDQQTIAYIGHIIKYLNMKQGMMGTRKITNSIVVEQAIGEYFKRLRDEFAGWTREKVK
jgi:predicted transcriptional regulator|tara:strand:- start:729 stop:953 length:225 start_codon:yes stop_codon:yes gene_type:complete